ncbi:hypothetical protein CN151_05010 [Sinorhizobium meliloti]|nr:hypothetical protein CN151_05010 [Sinorhizobium meliloti]RVM96607.1 hypothetical protein CN119_06345 [Sinorhizobium meliloti]RVN13447.1 hypothetical protein CN112_04285 [Sinorhizobium meliloti]
MSQSSSSAASAARKSSLSPRTWPDWIPLMRKSNKPPDIPNLNGPQLPICAPTLPHFARSLPQSRSILQENAPNFKNSQLRRSTGDCPKILRGAISATCRETGIFQESGPLPAAVGFCGSSRFRCTAA